MAIVKTARPAFIQMNRIYPAQYYARPALPSAAVVGKIGYTQRNLLNQYNYTIQQMAVSPFSVNNKGYIERIREHYGINDSGTYDLYGNIGAFIGAGLGGAYTLGFIKGPKSILRGQVFGSYNPKIIATRKARNVALSSSKNPNKYNYNTALVKNKKIVTAYNSQVDLLNESKKTYNALNSIVDTQKASKEAAEQALKAAQDAYNASGLKYNNLKGVTKGSQAKLKALEEINTLQKNLDTANDALTVAVKNADTAGDALRVTQEGVEQAHNVLKTTDKVFDSVELGTKAAAKTGGFVPIIGIGMDALSLSLSAASFYDSVQSGDTKGMWINGIATLLDAVALVADFFPGIGDAISIGASVASAGLTGAYMGKTVGHSLSPEGLRAQANFFKNLHSSVIARPVSTTASLLTMFGVQMVAHAGARNNSRWSKFWTSTALGNLGRQGVTMGAMQFVNKQATWLEDQLGITPTRPDQINFTSGIGIWGDINDNLFGATLRKTQMASLLDKDSGVSFSELFEKSWGITDKEDELYQSIMFADVREASGIEFKVPILNSAIDIIGETLVDPQNYVEAFQTAIDTKTKDVGVDLFESNFKKASEVVRLKQAALLEKDPTAVIKFDPQKEMFEYLTGPDGIFRGDSKNRVRLIRQLIDAYVDKGEVGLKRTLTDMLIMKNKGVAGTEFTTIKDSDAISIDLVMKLFDSVFKKNDFKPLKYTNPSELKTYRDRLVKLNQVVEDVKNKKTLTPDQEAIKAEASKLMKRLEDYYGEDSKIPLIDKFMEDLEIEIPNNHLRALYETSQDIRFHTDLANEASDISTWMFMPVQKIISFNNIRKAFKVAANFGRFVFRVKETAARTILEVADVFTDIQKNFTNADMKPLLDALPKDVTTIDDIVKPIVADNENIVDEGVKEIKKAVEAQTEAYEDIKQKERVYKEELKMEEKAYEEHDKYVYVPAKTTYGGNDDYVYITNDADARTTLKEAIAFEEKEIFGKGLTIDEYLRRNKDSLDAKKYEAQKIAAADYFQHVMYKTIFTASKEQQLYIVSLMSSMNLDIYNENINVLKAHGYFRRYFNSHIVRPMKEIQKENITKHTAYKAEQEELLKGKEKELKNAEESLERVDKELKTQEAELVKVNKEKNNDRSVFLSLTIEELKKTKDTLFKQRQTLVDAVDKIRGVINHEIRIIKSLEERVQKMENYDAAKAAVEARGEVWDEKVHVDKETMEYSAPVKEDIFDKLSWDEQTQMLNEIQRILRKNGVVYKYTVPGKEPVIIEFGQKLQELPMGTKLELEYTVDLTSALYGVISDVLKVNENTIIFSGLLKELTDTSGNPLNYDNWLKLGAEEQTKYVIQVLKDMNLTKEQQALLDGATIRTITSALSEVVLHRGVIKKPITSLSEGVLNRVVMSNLIKNNSHFKTKYDAIFKNLNELQTKIDELRKTAEKTEVQERQLLTAVIDQHIRAFNKHFQYMTAYKYIRDNIIKRVSKDASKDLFGSFEDLRGSELPDYKSVKELVKDPLKHLYTLEDMLIDYVESGVVKEILNVVSPSIEHAKLIASSGVSDSEDQAYVNSRVEAQQEAEEQQAIDKETKDAVDEEYNKILGDVSNYNMEGVKILDNLDTESKVKKQSFAKDIHDERKIEQVQREIFGGVPYVRDYTTTRVSLTPLLVLKKAGDKIPVNYNKIIKEHNRTSDNHRSFLRLFAEYLYHTIKESKGTLSLDEENIRKYPALRIGINFDTEEGKKEYFIRRIVATYEDQDITKPITLVYKNKEHAKDSTMTLRAIAFKKLNRYVHAHKDDKVFDGYDKDAEGFLTKDAIKKFAEDLADATEKEAPALYALKNTIWKEVVNTFEHVKVSQNRYLNRVLKRLDMLHSVERENIKALSESYYVVSYDVVTKLVYNRKEMKKLLEGIIKYDGVNDTGLLTLDIIKMIDSDLIEDYENKEPFLIGDYSDVIIQDGKVYLQKDKTNELRSLFNIVYKQRVSIKYLRALLEKIKATPEKRAAVELAYTEMINEYKDILYYNPVDLSKEVFKTSGGTEEEWQFIESNPDINSLYQMLVTDMNLRYSERTIKSAVTPEEKVEQVKQTVETMRMLLNPQILKLYDKSRKTSGSYYNMLEKSGLLEASVNAEHKEKILFGYLVLKATQLGNTPEETKRIKHLFLNNILFYNASIGKADYTDKKVEAYKKELKSLEGLTDKSNNNKRIVLENKIKKAEEVRNNLAYDFLETPEGRTNYFIDHPEKLADFFGFYRDTDDDDVDAFVMAKNKEGKYILVEKDISNYEIVSKGVPAINLAVFDVVNDLANKATHAIIQERINTPTGDSLWRLIDSKDIKDVFVGTNGNVVIITKDSVVKDKEGNEYHNVNTALHDTIKEKRTALIFELNKDRKDNLIEGIYTMSERQYSEIKGVSKDKLDTEPVYEAIEIGSTGRYYGETEQLVTTTSVKSLTEAYMLDMSRLTGIEDKLNKADGTKYRSYEEVFHTLLKYTEIYSNRVLLSDAYQTHVPFSASQSLQDLKNISRSLLVYYDFIEALKESGIDLSQIDLRLLTDTFFKKEFIKQDDEGNPFDLEKLNKVVKEQAWDIFQRLGITEKIKDALRLVQLQYGESDIIINGDYTLPEKFLDGVKTLKNTATRLLYNVKNYGRKLQNQIFSIIDKQYESDFLYGHRLEEMRDRMELNNMFLTSAGIDVTSKSGYLRNPLREEETFKETVKNLKEDFKIHDFIMMNTGEELYKKHSKGREAHNSVVAKRKNNRLNLSVFWNLVKTFNHGVTSKHALIEYENPELRKLSEQVYNVIKKYQEDPTSLTAKQVDRIQRFFVQSKIKLTKISNVDQVYNLILNGYIATYIGYIKEYVAPSSYELDLRLMWMGGSPEAEKLLEDYKKTIADKTRYKLNTGYRRSRKDPIAPEGTKDSALLEDVKASMFEAIIGKSATRTRETSKEVVDFLENYLFNGGEEAYKSETYKLREILKENKKTKTLPPTLAEYYKEILDNDDRVAIEFAINSIVFQRETKLDDSQSKALDRFIKEGKKIEAETIKDAWEILKKKGTKREKVTYNAYEVWNYFNLPLLNNSKEFMNYFLYEYLGTETAEFKVDEFLNLFGIEKDILLYFKKEKTLQAAFKKINDDLNAEDAYAFTQVVNTAKLLYLAKESNELGEPTFNLINAWQRHTRVPVREAQLKIKNMNQMGVFQGVYDSNVIKKVNDESSFIFDSLSYVKEKNNLLQQVLVPLEYKETTINDGNAKFVRQTEAQTLTEARRIQRELAEVFFKKEDTMSASSRQYLELTRELNEAPMHIISEANATHINEVSSDNKTYNTIMHLFHDIAKAIMGNKLLDKDFIRFGEVGGALKTLKESKNTKLYVGVFEEFIKQRLEESPTDVNKDTIEQAIEKTIEYFRSKNALVDLNETDIKGILGVILHYRFKDSYKINLDAKTFRDYNKVVIEARHKQYMRKLGRISHRLNGASDDDAVAKIIFGKSIKELEDSKDPEDKDHLSAIQLVKELRSLIKAGVTLEPEYLYDTYVEAVKSEKPLYEEDNVHTRKFSHTNTMYTSATKELERLSKQYAEHLKSVSLSINDVEIVKNNKDALEAEKKFKEEQIEATKETLEKFKENKKIESSIIYRNLINNHPELLLTYIKEQEDYISKKEKALQKRKDELAMHYSEDLRTKVNERLETERKLEVLKKSFRFKVYNYTRKMAPDKAQAYIWDNYKDALEKLGIAPGTATIQWLKKTANELKGLDNLIAGYKKNPIELKNSKGELIYSKNRIKRYIGELKQITAEEDRLESLIEKIVLDPEDILQDDETIKRIVTNFATSLFVKKSKLNKEEFDSLLKKAIIPPVTTEQKEKLLERFRKELLSIEKQTAKYLDRYNDEQFIYRYYPKDLSNHASYRVTKDKLDKLAIEKERVTKIIKNLEDSHEQSLKEIIRTSVERFIELNKLDFENSLEDIIDYLSGDALKEISSDIKSAGETLGKLDDELRAINNRIKVYVDILELPERIEKQKALVVQYEQQKINVEVAFNRTLEAHKLARVHGNSNLGTYKNLKGIKKETDIAKQDRKLLNELINNTTTVFNAKENRYYTNKELRELIKESGDLDIHNPVIDDLITAFNYMAQTGKTKNDEFFVFDMETIKHEGQDIPYLITIIHNEKGGKMTIQSVYFNSIAFHRDVINTDTGKVEDTPSIIQFKKDLFDMYAQRVIKHKSIPDSPVMYKLTVEETNELKQKAEDEAERIIRVVSTQKNNQEFVRAYLSIFEYANNNKIPIVTHAGERFDIPNYTGFIRKYANTLLTNMYYANIYTKSPESILERYGVSSMNKLDDIEDNDMKDSIIAEMNQELKELFTRLEKRATTGVYEELTDSELKLITKLNEAIYRVNISKQLRTVEESLGIHLNDEVKDTLFNPQTGEIVKVKKLVSDWLHSNTKDRTMMRQALVDYYMERLEISGKKTPNHNYIKELEDKLDKLLNKLEEEYNQIRYHNKNIVYTALNYRMDKDPVTGQDVKVDTRSRRTKMVHGVFMPEETDITYEAQKFLEGYIRDVQRLTSTKEMLETLDKDTLNKTIASLEKEAEDLLKEKTKLTEAIELAESQIRQTNKDSQDYLTSLTDFARNVQNRTSRLFYHIRKAVSSAEIYLKHEGKNNTINPITESVLNYGIARTLKELNEVVNEIDILVKTAQTIVKAQEKATGKKIEDLNTVGLYESEWFKFDKQADVTAAKQILIDQTKEYKELLADMVAHKEYGELRLRVLLNNEFAKVQETQEKFVIDLIKRYNDYAKRQGLNELTIDISAKKIDMESFNKFQKTIEDSIKKLIASSGLSEQKYIEDNPEIKTILEIIKLDGSLERNLVTLKLNYSSKNNIYDTYRDIFIQGLEQSIRTNEAKINALDNIDLKDTKTVAIELLNLKLKTLLESVKQGDLLQEEMQAQSILNLVSDRGQTSQEMTPEKFVEVARRKMDKMFVDALDEPYTVRKYDTALRYNNKKALMMREDKVYYKPVINEDGSMTFVFNFFDQTTQSTNQITINTHNPEKLRSNFKYVYRYANQPLDKPREISLERLKFKDTQENYGEITTTFLNVSKTIDNFYKKYTPGITGANVYKVKGKDGSFESLKRALTFYETKLKKAIKSLPSNYNKLTTEEQVAVFQKHFKDILDESVNAYALDIKNLEVVDMTQRTEKMFLEYVKTARLLAGRKGFRDAPGVYQSLSDRLLSKYNSLVPGKILNLIAPEFATDFIIQYDDKSLYEMNIDLLNSSEGSMGTSFSERSPYSTHLPFKHNTNGIRVGLSNTQQYKDHSAIGLLNALYLVEDAELKNIFPDKYDHDVSKYLDHLKPKDGDWDKRVVFLKNKTLSTYDKVEDKKDILMEYTEEVITRLEELITPHAFIPQVLSKEDKQKYLNDSLHKRGVNLSVVFANDARAFEDVILYDYDDAMALGWNKGYKTWLGLYGFKGGVRLVKGLRAQYGASLVASATSVVKRGSYGALVEMFINNFKEAYYEDSKKPLTKSNVFYDLVKAYKDPNSAIHKYVTFEDGFAIVKPNINYTELFNEVSLFKKYEGLTEEEKLTSIFDMYLGNKTGKKVSYNYTINNEDTTVVTNAKDGWRGTLYVTLDSEHITEHMANKAELKNYGGIVVAQVDQSGTVLNGVVLSESVLYPMLAKASDRYLNWSKAFYDDEDPQHVMFTNKLVNLYTDIAYKGIDYVLDNFGVYVGGQLSVSETIRTMEENQLNNNIITYVREYISYDYLFVDEQKTNTDLVQDISLRKAELNQKIKQQAHERLTGDRGILRASLFKKHFGGRQQLLANVDNKRGEAITNKDIWDNNIKKDANWAIEDTYTEAAFKKDIINHVYERTGTVKKGWTKDAAGTYSITVTGEKELNDVLLVMSRHGMINKPKENDVFKVTRKGDSFTITTKLIYKYGWMLTMRSPVQDYNAVSLIKIIGYHDHNALEADKYLYKRIGGDNDGDTIGMIAISKDKKKYLEPLDATRESFYDRNYFNDVDEDYIKLEDKTYITPKRPNIKGIDITHSNVGKNFVGSFINNEGKKQKIRNNYTWSELYIQTFPSYDIETFITKETHNKKMIASYKGLEEIFSKDEALVRAYLNAYIRRETGGYDTTKGFHINDYGNLKKMLAFIKKENLMPNLLGRYAFDLSIRDHKIKIEDLIKITSDDIYEMFYSLDTEDQDKLSKDYKMFDEEGNRSPSQNLNAFLSTNSELRNRIIKEVITNKVLSKLFQITTSRVQASKVGINYFGGNRKNQMIAVMLSRFTLINKDKGSSFWDYINAYDSVTKAMTPTSLMQALFNDTFTTKMKENRFSTVEDAIKEGLVSVKDKFTYKIVEDKKQKEVTNSLLDTMRDSYKGLEVADGMTTKLNETDANEFIEEAVEVIFNAYKHADTASQLFPKLQDALNASVSYSIVDFFNEPFIKDEDLLPMVKRIKDSKKEKLEPFEIEWLKIQFWGANKQEATTFINNINNKESSKLAIEKYIKGYLNEVIITRKDFKRMSDNATRIIGLAKHEGNDIQVHKYIMRYMKDVIEETVSQRMRTTNLDSKRAYLNYTIAMNRNPFEDNSDVEIKDPTYLKLIKERKVGKRAVLQKTYTDTRSAKRNLEAIARDNFDIQILGRFGVNNVIHNHVEDALFNFLNAFKDVNISDSRQLVKVAKSDTVKRAAEILAQFNVAGYKIRNFVMSYMFNYNYINNILTQENKALIDFDDRNKVIVASSTFMELLYKVATRIHQERYRKLLGIEAPLVNKILESVLEVDEDYYTWDDEGNLIERVDITEKDTNIVHKDDIQETLAYGQQDHSRLPVFIKDGHNAKDYKILRTFLDKLKLNTSQQHTNFEDTLKELLREYNVLRAVYYNDHELKKELKEMKDPKSPESIRQKRINKKVTNYTLIEDDLRNLFQVKAMYIKNLHTLKEKQRQLNNLNNKLGVVENKQKILESLIDKDTGSLRSMADIKEQIKLIDEKIKLANEKFLKTEENIFEYTFNNTFNEMLPLLYAQDGSSIQNLYTYSTPRLLTNKDVDDFHNSILMNMHHRMSPFLNSIDAFKKPDGSLDYDEMTEWYKSRYDFVRLTIIRKPDDTEGLLRRLSTEIWQSELDNKGKKKSKLMFKSEKDIEDFKDKLKLGADQESLRFGKKEYDGIALDLDTKRFITPTLKEINIRNAKDFQTLYEGIVNQPGAEFLIGFVMINDIMDAYDQAYLPYKQTGFASGIISKMLSTSKFIQRLSMGFLVRNWLDTWNQLYSEAQMKYGNIGVLFKFPEILKIMRGVSDLKSIYHRVSIDRILYLTAFKGHYEELKNILDTHKVITPENKQRLLDILDINIRVLESYRDAELDADEFSSRVVNKQQGTHSIITALKLLKAQADKDINNLKLRQNLSILERGVSFISSMKFAEYFVLYDKLADVYDATHLYESKNVAYINNIKQKQKSNWNNFKTDLFELSAFMQTHAQRDEYQTKQARTIDEVLNEMMAPDQQAPKNYTVISKEIENELSAETSSFVNAFKKNLQPWTKGGDIKGLYSWITADTETSGRIAGYFLDKYLHDLTFEQSVQKSLTRFFDYGALSPLEKNMLADIPYLSFPIRSINNWINRITDPRYLRHLSDFLDGMYGQYADEDGQYSDFVKYQMANGWIPIANGYSLRAGNGAFDVMQFLTDPASELEKRRGPFGRMLAAVVDYITSEEKNEETLLSDVIKQSAVTGFATRAINQITSNSASTRNTLANTPVVRNLVDTREPVGLVPGLARASSFVHWYDEDKFSKYTPKKYDYSQGNGRYKYYENIYRDWFNKYGRMRKPKVDPYSLVKDIQWKNYVRWRRQQYMNKYK